MLLAKISILLSQLSIAQKVIKSRAMRCLNETICNSIRLETAAEHAQYTFRFKKKMSHYSK